MKRLLISALLATGLHLIFFVSMPMLFQEKHKPARNEIKSVMITMSYRDLVSKKKHPPKKQTKKKPVPKIIKAITPKPLQPLQVKKMQPELVQTKMNKPEPTQTISPEPLQKKDTGQKPSASQTTNKTSSDFQNKENISQNKKSLKITDPVYKNNPLPQYPIRARKRGYEGIVELMVQVSKKGRVSNLWIFKSSNYKSLDNQAVKVIKKWIFEPGRKNGTPEKMWVKIPVKFELKHN